ncbi:MAG: AAA family ATPase, partial [Halobaculum sp.]
MSQGSDSDEPVEVTHDGLVVTKRFDAEEFPVPAIAFTISSRRSEPVEVRLVDRIPDDFPMDRVGFHPEYEAEHWTAYQDQRVEFRRRLGPDEEVQTVYGIRTDSLDDIGRFLDEPTVEEIAEEADLAGDVADVIGDDSSQVVRDVLSGDRDAVPGADDEPTPAEGAEADLSSPGAAPGAGTADDPLGASGDDP